ncbi:zinc finger and SCAN domain-containing protein 5B [Dipodomys spectabilis]|uniref:zinc finger and SCAN domain-containing protein 5B n=1 Tax=Dipodomys spectabilis TaxID=105255 RepID=UPI001C53AE3F|nr:zinc finger and SCAN domain-containing protein 5B [Dipodomys spectabilis]
MPGEAQREEGQMVLPLWGDVAGPAGPSEARQDGPCPPSWDSPEPHDPDTERWHLSFRLFSAPVGTHPVQVLWQLWELCHLWLRPDLYSKEEMLDRLVIEQFLLSVPEHLQVLVKESGVRRCRDLEKLLRHSWEPTKWVVEDVEGRQCLVPVSQLQEGRAEAEVEDQEDEADEAEEDGAIDLTAKPQPPCNQEPEDSIPAEVMAGSSGGQQQPQSENVDKAEAMNIAAEEDDTGGDWTGAPGPSPQPLSLQGPDAAEGEPRSPHEEAGTPAAAGHQRDLAETGRAERRPSHSPGSPEESPSPGGTGGRPEAHGGRQHQCGECGKCFQYKSQFVIHQRTHSGERPFLCHTCGKGFMQPSDLRVHLRIHTGEKPYQCRTCLKRFTHESTLLGHQRVHTRETPFRCADCGAAFSHRGNLNVHMRIHTGEKPYACRHCALRFRQLGTCRRHERRHGKGAAAPAPNPPQTPFRGDAGSRGPGAAQ